MSDAVLSVRRSELKYYLSYQDALNLKKRLRSILQPDAFSQRGAYRVKSLYFDSLNNIDFNSKLNGENVRKKIRLRIYDECASTVKLECKAKEGRYQHKQSLIISRTDAAALCSGEFSALLQYDQPQALQFYTTMVLGCYRPAVVVEYQREAFMHPLYNTRITFDSEIKSSELFLDLFQHDLPWQAVLDELVVLEVKFNGQLLGFISECLKSTHLVSCAVSKYCGSRHIMQDYI